MGSYLSNLSSSKQIKKCLFNPMYRLRHMPLALLRLWLKSSETLPYQPYPPSSSTVRIGIFLPLNPITGMHTSRLLGRTTPSSLPLTGDCSMLRSQRLGTIEGSLNCINVSSSWIKTLFEKFYCAPAKRRIRACGPESVRRRRGCSNVVEK
jgi:hypothetical protein